MNDLGILDKPKKKPFERTFRYIGSNSSWSWGLFWFTFSILSIISFLSDALQKGSFEALWFVVSGAAFLPPLTLGLGYKLLVLKRNPSKSRPFLNLLVGGLVGSTRNISVGLFANLAGLDSDNLWEFRFVGGFIAGMLLYAVWAFANGAKIDYLDSLSKLADTQTRLVNARSQIPEQLATINEGLQERTKQALLPQLSAITLLLGTNSHEALSRLRSTITEQIRPIMQEIEKEQPLPFKTKNFRKLTKVSSKLPDRFILHDKLMVTWSSVLEIIGSALWLFLLGTADDALNVLILFSLYFGVLSICKVLIPKKKVFSKSSAISITVISAFLASASNAIFVYYFVELDYLQTLMLIGFLVVEGVIAPVLLMQLSVRNERRTEIENQISQELFELSKENSLFSQKLWVFRKRWLLVLHGSVQSALTAATTRLQKSDIADSVVLQLVKQDLQRAEAAVLSNLTDTIDFEKELKELQELWAGICDIETKVSERARRALAKNHDSSFCANEVVKEAVSNAVRHGDATKVKVSIDRFSDDVVLLEISNNGKRPEDNRDGGIGTEMLREISLSWELVSDNKSVRLLVELPVKL